MLITICTVSVVQAHILNMLLETPLPLRRTIFSFLSLTSRYTNDLGTVCKCFHDTLRSLGLSVSVDIIFYPISSNLPDRHSDPDFEVLPHSNSPYFHSVRCLLSPPPNPFRYPHTAVGDTCDTTGGDDWSSYDVHCSIDVFEEQLTTIHQQHGDNTFLSTLRRFVQTFLGGTLFTSFVVRGPEKFPFASQLDMLHYVQRRPKAGTYAAGDALENDQMKQDVTDAWLTVTSVKSFASQLQPLPNLRKLILLFDAPPGETNADSLSTMSSCGVSQQHLDVLSLSYLDENTDAYCNKNPSSVKFFTSMLQIVSSVQHVFFGPMAAVDHIAPLLRVALGRNLQTLSFPLQDVSGYLQLMSTDKHILMSMSSTIRCLVISGYDMDVMTVPYICHIIRIFANLSSLRWLVFDMGDEYNDFSEVSELAITVEAAKVHTADIRKDTKLDVFFDFERQ